MKTLLLLLLSLILVVSVSCGGEENGTTPTPTTGTISGTLSLQAGVSGNLDNSRVAIYSSYDDWLNDRVLLFTASSGGSPSTYSLGSVTPGTYYLDAWKDVNNNGLFDSGDLFGWYGTGQYPNPTLSPFSVSAGQTATINVTCIVLP